MHQVRAGRRAPPLKHPCDVSSQFPFCLARFHLSHLKMRWKKNDQIFVLISDLTAAVILVYKALDVKENVVLF